MVTYKDIANMAKVSKTTVSHYVNKTRDIAPATVKRLENAIKELQYKPNLLARSLAVGKTNTIGFVISNIRNPDYSELIRSIEILANQDDYNIFLCDTDFDIDMGIKSVRALISKRVDGIICVMSQANIAIINELIESKIPFVLLDSDEKNADYDFTYIDFKPGMYKAIDYLVLKNHKKIYYNSGPLNLKTSLKRREIFINGVKRYKNIEYKIFEGNHKLGGGIEVVRKIINSGDLPTAIMCSNDLSASGTLREFIACGYKIPEDISIIGTDNSKLLCTLAVPALTSIDISRFDTGKWAYKMLMNRIKDPRRKIQKKIIKTKLVIRDSAGKAKE